MSSEEKWKEADWHDVGVQVVVEGGMIPARQWDSFPSLVNFLKSLDASLGDLFQHFVGAKLIREVQELLYTFLVTM